MLHIKSKIPALLEIDKEYLIENHIQKISFDKDNLIIKYYPLQKVFNGKQTLPSIIKLDSKSLINCRDYTVTLYPNNNVEITLLPFTLDNNLPAQKSTFSILNSTKSIDIYTTNTTTFAINFEDNYLYHTLPNCFMFFKGVEIDNTIHLIFKQENEYYYIQISSLSIKKSCYLTDCSITKNKLVATIPFFDMAKHAKAIEISFDKPYLFQEKTIYQNNSPKLFDNMLLLPYAFLESIKAKNYKLARQYITSTMSNKLSDKTLSTFFGDIKHITHDIYNDKVCIIYSEQNKFVAKDYVFEYQNNKISNINEV